MDPNPPSDPVGQPVPAPQARARRSAGLAWAITACEGFLWLAAAWAFSQYWLMLPLRYRVAGVTLLALSAAFALGRLARFYRKR